MQAVTVQVKYVFIRICSEWITEKVTEWLWVSMSAWLSEGVGQGISVSEWVRITHRYSDVASQQDSDFKT